MKNTIPSKIKFPQITFVLLIYYLITTVYVTAQDNYSNSTRKPNNVGYIHSSGGEGSFRNVAGKVITFNPDNSRTSNENFYVSHGSWNTWWNNVKLEVQREGGVGTRNGMFMDTGHLYLVADWDNTSNSENIIFGFNNNLRSYVHERMRLTQNGFLALGSKSPKGILHLKHPKNSYDAAGFILENHTSSSAYNLINSNNNLFIGFNNNSAANYPQSSYQHRFFIGSNGNIGIGTANPKEKLDVNGDMYTNGKLHVNEEIVTKGNIQLFANEGENQSGTAYLQAKDKSGNSNIGLQLRTQKEGNFINALKIDPNGNLGIGITAPTEKLDVQGNITTTIGNHILLKQGTLSDHKGLYLVGDRDNNSENEDIIFGFDGNTRESIQEKMRLTDEGNLGIGTNIPSEKLEVSGKVKATSFVTSLQSFPDYVFDKEYKLQSLSEIKKYVEIHRHLPGMPSESDIVKNGLDLKEVTVISVEKIEQLFLYMIRLQQEIKKQKKINFDQKRLSDILQENTENKFKNLEQRILQLEKSN